MSMKNRPVTDFEFAPQHVWRAFEDAINGYFEGTASAETSLAALDGYSKDIWGAPATYLDAAILEDDTAERAMRWNALLGYLTWNACYANR